MNEFVFHSPQNNFIPSHCGFYCFLAKEEINPLGISAIMSGILKLAYSLKKLKKHVLIKAHKYPRLPDLPVCRFAYRKSR
jgi:hypothetical protein